MMSDKVRPHHLQRKALLYVRQSPAHQVLYNRESSALQYAMRDWLMALGTHDGYVSWERVRGNPRNDQQQCSHCRQSRRAQAWRHAAGRSDPVQALWPQAYSPVHRHEAPYPVLQLQPRLDGQWRPSLHRLRGIALR